MGNEDTDDFPMPHARKIAFLFCLFLFLILVLWGGKVQESNKFKRTAIYFPASVLPNYIKATCNLCQLTGRQYTVK
ncbi:hypothetical protein, partial [Fischerella thermalis]